MLMNFVNYFYFYFIYFFREEIQRIKTANPEIPHREAFSAAAKNVSFSSNQIISRILPLHFIYLYI